jgi:hypothetical protein
MRTIDAHLINCDALIYNAQQRMKQRLLEQIEYHERRIERLRQIIERQEA